VDASTRVAAEHDLPFLCDTDRHLSAEGRSTSPTLGYVDSGVLLLPDEPAELILRHALG
jgi:hypothetical protein